MNIFISHKPSDFNHSETFSSGISSVFCAVDNDFYKDIYDKNVTSSNVAKSMNAAFNHSYDGEIYWLPQYLSEKFINQLTIWFSNEDNHDDSFIADTNGVLNCILVKKTPNGIFIIDPLLDMGSTFNDFIGPFLENNQDASIICYSDCHLVDHMVLGRDSCNNEFEIFYKLYKENILTDRFFLCGLSSFSEDESYEKLLEQEKTIVLTGTFNFSKKDLQESLQYAGFTFAEQVTGDNDWLWCGKDVDPLVLEEALKMQAKTSTISELIDMTYQNYLNTKSM